jgi:hypothetical protein
VLLPYPPWSREAARYRIIGAIPCVLPLIKWLEPIDTPTGDGDVIFLIECFKCGLFSLVPGICLHLEARLIFMIELAEDTRIGDNINIY